MDKGCRDMELVPELLLFLGIVYSSRAIAAIISNETSAISLFFPYCNVNICYNTYMLINKSYSDRSTPIVHDKRQLDELNGEKPL
jgi:hypothetical protein